MAWVYGSGCVQQADILLMTESKSVMFAAAPCHTEAHARERLAQHMFSPAARAAACHAMSL